MGNIVGVCVDQVTNFKDKLPWTASDESKGANDRAALSFCHHPGCQGKEGSFFPLIIGPFYPLSTVVLKNMISFFESFEWLQTFCKRPNCGEPRRSVSFCDWSVDGTVGSCYVSTASAAKGEEGGKNTRLKLINFGSEKKILSSKLKCHLPNIIL